MTTPNDKPALLRIDALAAVDAAGCAVSPASILLDLSDRRRSIYPARLLAIDTPSRVDSHEAAASPRLQTIRRPRSLLIPGLVNSHTHLDLTHIGPQPHDPAQGFVPWVNMVRSGRAQDAESIASSVHRGIALSLTAGTVAVGDIAGAVGGRIRLEPWQTLQQSPLVGVCWLEFFGIGRGLTRTEEMLDALLPNLREHPGATVRLGLQPHAPNTVARSLYRKAIAMSARFDHGAPLSTHLAETPEERRFITEGAGPQCELLEQFGLWDDAILADLAHGQHPVAHMAEILAQTPFTVAHVNDADDAAIEVLARTRTRVAYCPRASAYFGAERHFGPHRYRDMLAAGITVALGTDSLVNLTAEAAATPAESPAGRGMSILDEMRFLHSSDQADPLELLRMGTVNGAVALGLDPAAFTFTPGAPLAGLLALPVAGGPEVRGPTAATLLRATFRSAGVPEPLLPRKLS